MKKISYEEFDRAMRNFNSEHGITQHFDENGLKGVIVFKQESFTKPYTERERSYKTDSSQKHYLSNMLGNSIFGDCLDGTDNGVRLDWYMFSENGWKVDYCYILED